MSQTKKSAISDYEKQLRKYYFLCFISEFSKIIIFLLVFMAAGLTKEYFAALFALMVLRNNGGGLHFKHYISCLIVSFSFLCGSILLALFVTPPQIIVCAGILFCIPVGYCFAPITSSNRPAATPEQIKKSKRNTSIILSLFFILCCICPPNTWLYIGFWTVILHIAQLGIAYAARR